MGMLVSPDGSIAAPGVFFIAGIPLLAIGHYRNHGGNYSQSLEVFGKPAQLVAGVFLVFLGLVLSFLNIIGDRREEGGDSDLEYEMIPPDQILNELKHLPSFRETSSGHSDTSAGNKENHATATARELNSSSRATSLRCLTALAVKYGQEQKKKKEKKQKTRNEAISGSWNGFLSCKPHELETICQDAAYIALKLHPSDDSIVAAAISLLALVAGDTEVRRRHIEEADRFGLNVPVIAMRDSLRRAKLVEVEESENAPEKEERLSAELQRKGCLLLGAISDGDKNIATKVVDEDGLKAVLDAIDWYRYHSDVANWSLWSVFVLCYDHKGNKGELMKMGGIQRVCRVLKDNPESLEVARHGIAILFDMMREVPGTMADLSHIRMIAMNSGVHGVVLRAMTEFPESVEIMMMGQQMLVATGYTGNIPQLNKNKEHKKKQHKKGLS